MQSLSWLAGAWAVLTAACAVSFLELPLRAQALKATILGTVTDSSGAAVPNVRIVIAETNTNVTRSTNTNDTGYYVVANLDPGTYRVEAQHPVFRREARLGIDLVADTTARVDLALSPGEQTEVVKGGSWRGIGDTDTAETGQHPPDV